MIPYSKQFLSEDDIAAVVAVLRSDFLTQGPEIPRFEKAARQFCGAEHAVAVSSGTSALHLACLAMGLGPGDCLWTSPITFVASANCALYCGATVDFVDIDSSTYNMSPEALKEKLAHARRAGKLPKIVVPVHLAGQSCAMEKIFELSREYGFHILEDASHALGATYRETPVGKCEFSDAAVFSFHAVKMITTGEGGMVVTNDAGLAARVARLRTHGITRAKEEMAGGSEEDWYYEQTDLGVHARMTDIQAALGRSQMRALPQFLSRRREVAAWYGELLAGSPYGLPWQDPAAASSWHLFILQCADAEARKRIFAAMRKGGVGVNVHYIPVYRQPYYRKLGFPAGYCPKAEAYYARALSVPVHPGLERNDVESLARMLRELA